MPAKVVVITEDEPLIRLVAVDILANAGFEVIEAEHADAALKALHGRGGAVHVLFTDINMPGPMDGLALVHHVHLRWPHIRYLVVSGKVRPEPGQVPPGTHFLPKPYVLAEVISHIQELSTS